VSFTAGWVLDRIPHNPEPGGVQPPQDEGQRLLTMITCAELFHSDWRLAAFGELLSVKQKPAH
jgi:sortase A